MRLKTKYEIKRGYPAYPWEWALDAINPSDELISVLLKLPNVKNDIVLKNIKNGDIPICVGKKKYCISFRNMLKRREFLSSIADIRESQRRELREGAE